jgi:hypothetical protein
MLRYWAGGMAQVTEHLSIKPSKCEALNSNPSTAKRKSKTKQESVHRNAEVLTIQMPGPGVSGSEGHPEERTNEQEEVGESNRQRKNEQHY